LHATLFSRDGAWYVLDESRHGTFLQGQRLKRGEPAAVRHGDRLRFGDCEFVVQSSAPAHDAERIDPLQYRLSVQTVDLSAAVDASRVLQSALELPERLGNAATEAQMYAAACEYLVKTLSPAIAAAYVTVGDADSKLEVLGRAARDGEGARPELLRPIVSRRILQRLRDAPDSVVFLQRKLADATLDATVNSCTRSLGASWLEADALDRPTVLHIVGDQVLGDGEQLVAQYLRLVSTLLRQHMRTLRNAHLATYFSPKVVELLMKKGGRALIEGSPRLSCCTSLFFDVRGSSPAIAAAALDLTRVYTELRAIIEDVTDAIFETDGTIIDYAGDGVFAAWGIPFEQRAIQGQPRRPLRVPPRLSPRQA
jgi:PAS domain-containing protein